MLPDHDQARVDRAKVVDYLLSRDHPDGRSKAEFFTRYTVDGSLPTPDGRTPRVRMAFHRCRRHPVVHDDAAHDDLAVVCDLIHQRC